MRKRVIQAYQQAPWRVQLQWIGLFLLTLVSFALVAGLYLNVSAQAAAAGVEVQNLESTREALLRKISNDTYTLASLSTSKAIVQSTPDDFVPADPANTLYVAVPGYTGRQTARLGSSPAPLTETQSETIMKSAYTESLWEWMIRGMFQLSSQARD